MSGREKSAGSSRSSSATPPPIGESASPGAGSTGGGVNTAGGGASGANAPANGGGAPQQQGGFVMPPGMTMPPGMQFMPYFPQPATGGAGGAGDSSDPNAAQAGQAQQPQQMMIHPAFIPQMYSYPYPGMLTAGMKLKRRQVKNACTNCQKACKKCDDERPCPRCVKYGIADECQDSVRKERRKGIKRGSYKKKGESDDGESGQPPSFMPYPAQLYSQWAAAAMSAAGASGKPGETPGYYPYFITPVPPPAAGGEAGPSGEGGAATATPVAANPYFSQMYYGAYPPGYPVPAGYGGEATGTAAAGSSKSAASNNMKSEEESEDELEEEEEEEPEESPKRKSKKKRRSSD